MKLYGGEIWALIFSGTGLQPRSSSWDTESSYLVKPSSPFLSKYYKGTQRSGRPWLSSQHFLPPQGWVDTVKNESTCWLQLDNHLECTNLVNIGPWIYKSVAIEMWWPKTNFKTNDIKLNPLKYKRPSFERESGLEVESLSAITKFCTNY